MRIRKAKKAGRRCASADLPASRSCELMVMLVQQRPHLNKTRFFLALTFLKPENSQIIPSYLRHTQTDYAN